MLPVALSEAENAREAAGLTALRDDLRGGLMVQPIIHIEGLAEVWAKGNPARRCQPLIVIFDQLIVRDGEITEFIPRADRGSDVIGLIQRAIPDVTCATAVSSTESSIVKN